MTFWLLLIIWLLVTLVFESNNYILNAGCTKKELLVDTIIIIIWTNGPNFLFDFLVANLTKTQGDGPQETR